MTPVDQKAVARMAWRNSAGRYIYPRMDIAVDMRITAISGLGDEGPYLEGAIRFDSNWCLYLEWDKVTMVEGGIRFDSNWSLRLEGMILGINLAPPEIAQPTTMAGFHYAVGTPDVAREISSVTAKVGSTSLKATADDFLDSIRVGMYEHGTTQREGMLLPEAGMTLVASYWARIYTAEPSDVVYGYGAWQFISMSSSNHNDNHGNQVRIFDPAWVSQPDPPYTEYTNTWRRYISEPFVLPEGHDVIQGWDIWPGGEVYFDGFAIHRAHQDWWAPDWTVGTGTLYTTA